MKLAEWLGSKKTKDMLVTQLLIIVAAHLGLSMEVIAIVAALGGVKIGAQGMVDKVKAAKAPAQG